VIPRSPAADAGLRFGDVLTALNGVPLTSSPQLQTTIAEAEVDQEVRLRVRRSGGEKEFVVKLGNLSESKESKSSLPYRRFK
jgi:S1-C subfamily serine protease